MGREERKFNRSIYSELWRKENTLQHTLTSLKEELAKADQALRSMAGKVGLRVIFVGNFFGRRFYLILLFQAILNGRDSVRKVLETFRQRGGLFGDLAKNYYGQVIENFQCDTNIQTAVEVTAGGR